MESVREHYWRYSLFVIILALGAVICVELAPYVGGLLGAMTIYVVLRGQMPQNLAENLVRRMSYDGPKSFYDL